MRRFGLLLGIALAATAPTFAAGCAHPIDDGAEAGDSELNAGQKLLFNRLMESVAPLRKVVQNDQTELGANFRKLAADTDSTFAADTKLDIVGKVARNTLSSLGKQQTTRRAMVRSSLEALTRRSDTLKAKIISRASIDGSTVAQFDDLVIGMGPQAVAYVQEATRSAIESGQAARRIVAIDIGNKPGGTFANVADAFFLNSTNRADTGVRAAPGRGDLNFLYDLWGVRDFDSRTWPTAGGIGDVSTVGMDISTSHALLETELVSVERVPILLETLYNVRLRDVKTGNTFSVTTRRIIGATGIGKPFVPIKDEATLALIAEEAAKKAQSIALDEAKPYIPGVQTFTDFINYVGQADEPYRWLVNKSVVVAGGGDSANVINEFLMRIGPTGAYKFDSAQVGNVGKVYWLGVSFDDCKSFIDQARGRYALLESALNNGRLVPVPTKISSIARTGSAEATKFKVTSGIVDPANLKTTTSDEGSIFSTGADAVVGAQLDVDYVLLATGFRSDAYNVFKPLIGDVDADSYAKMLRKVQGAVQGFNGDDSAPVVDIATQLNEENIFFIGPANEVVGGLPSQSELARVNANTVSFFANVARTRQLARQLEIVYGAYPSIEGIYSLPKIQLNRARAFRTSDGATLNNFTNEIIVPPVTAQIEIAAEMAKALEQFDLPGDLELTIRITRKTGQGLPAAEVSIEALDTMSESNVAQAITASPRLSQLIFGYLGPNGKVKQIEIVGTTSPAGNFGWDIDVLPRVNIRQ